MFCKYCGKKLPDNANFCSKCGKKIASREKQVKDLKQTCDESTSYDSTEKATALIDNSAEQDLTEKNNNDFHTPMIENLLILGHEAYYLEKDYSEALKWYEKAAELNDSVAQFYLGYMYYKGKGVTQDYGKALEWCQKAATQDDDEAQCLLGDIYYNGEGVNQDYKEAAKWYEKAASKDNRVAQFYLGEMYFNGKGLERDYKKAFKFCKNTEDYVDSLYKLGYMYEHGEGTEQDYDKAFDMYSKAAELGDEESIEWLKNKTENEDADAQYQLATMFIYGQGIEKNETKANELFKKAFITYEKSAEQGNPNAQFKLGTMFYYGFFVEQNDKEAFNWYKKSAEQGNENAQHGLGEFYQYGHQGMKRNYEKAIGWYKKAAAQGNPEFQWQLGRIYHCIIDNPDYEKSFIWYQKAAEQGDSCAQNELGNMYFDGVHVKQNFTEAFKWYKKADSQLGLGDIYRINNNYSRAIECYGKMLEMYDGMYTNGDYLRTKFIISIMYYYGEGLDQNYEKAFKWCKEPAEQGIMGALSLIGNMYLKGNGVEQNYKKAFEWLKKAANCNDDYAQFQIGLMYCYGDGIEQNYEKALEYFEKAALHGNKAAVELLEKLEQNQSDTNEDKRMKENVETLFQQACEFARNNEFEKAIPFFEQAAEQGHDGAIESLAIIYIDGQGVKQNLDKGLKYLQMGVNNGDVYLINYLGTLYMEGKGVPKDYEQAFTSFSIAAENGYPYALINLADCFEQGHGTEIDIDEAVNCYLEVLDGDFDDDVKELANMKIKKYKNHPAVLYNLSQKCISLDDYEKSDTKRYIELLEKSAKGGFANAQYELGKMYESGLHVEKDTEKAKEWIEKAAKQGHEEAIYTLQYMTNPKSFDKGKTIVNKTKYRYKGKTLFRKYLALEVIKDFVVKHPEATLKSLNETFTVQNKWGFDFEFFFPYDKAIVNHEENDYYFNEPIKLGNGEVIAVKKCSDFTIVNGFKDIAVQYGFDIEEVK